MAELARENDDAPSYGVDVADVAKPEQCHYLGLRMGRPGDAAFCLAGQ